MISEAARSTKRVKLFQPANLVMGGAERRCHLLDVSLSGALAHAQEPVAKGARVRLECLGVVREASVRWSEGKRFGLLFGRPLADGELDKLAGTSARAPNPPARVISAG